MKPTLTLLTALLLAPLAALHADEPKQRFNVLLIMADDLREFGGAFTIRNVAGDNPDIVQLLSEQLQKVGKPQP